MHSVNGYRLRPDHLTVGEIRKRLEKLGTSRLFFAKHALSKRASPDTDSKTQNADPQESDPRPLAASQALDGPDGSMFDSVEESTGGSREGEEMADLV